MKPRRGLPILACPSCQAADLRPHCESPTCDWARCPNCHSYGRDDLSRWVDGRKKESA